MASLYDDCCNIKTVNAINGNRFAPLLLHRNRRSLIPLSCRHCIWDFEMLKPPAVAVGWQFSIQFCFTSAVDGQEQPWKVWHSVGCGLVVVQSGVLTAGTGGALA